MPALLRKFTSKHVIDIGFARSNLSAKITALPGLGMLFNREILPNVILVLSKLIMSPCSEVQPTILASRICSKLFLDWIAAALNLIDPLAKMKKNKF